MFSSKLPFAILQQSYVQRARINRIRQNADNKIASYYNSPLYAVFILIKFCIEYTLRLFRSISLCVCITQSIIYQGINLYIHISNDGDESFDT